MTQNYFLRVYGVVRMSGFWALLFVFCISFLQVTGQTASITITNSSIGGSGVLSTSNYNSGAERTWTQSSISFGGKAITCNPANTPTGASACQYIQAQAGNGVIYNTSALPGRLVSVRFIGSASTASSLFGGTSRLVNTTTGNYTVTGGTQIGTAQTSNDYTWTTGPSDNYTFFCIKRGGTAQYFSSIIITYETASGFTVTFNGNGSTGGSMANQTASAATNLTSNAFTRTGYTFAGWNTAANGSGTSYANGASFPFTANTTLYAQWTANTLTITYNSQGGSAISNGTTTTGGAIATSPGTPTRAGFAFNGWFTSSSGGSAITFPYTHGQTSNFTLFAQWTALPDPEPTNHATAFGCSAAFSSIDLSWDDATGAQLPAGYLIKWSSTSYAAITNPTDGSTANGANSTTVAQGTETATISGLTSGTTYYFKIWPYTNSSTDIDYKTNGTIPQTSCATSAGGIVNFDDAGNWTINGTGYQSGHVYAESGWSFTGGPALRETSGSQDGFPRVFDTYAWRLENNSSVAWTATWTTAGTIKSFGFDVRRWDDSPSPNFRVEYSVNGGSSYTSTGITINNAYLSNSSDWTSLSFNLPSSAAVSANGFVVRVRALGTTERIMIDNFTWSEETASVFAGAVSGAPFTMAGCGSTQASSIAYTVSGVFNGGNVFTAELSDGNGEFTQPLAIGSVTAITAGNIAVTIPENLQTGSGYRIRILSSNPATVGTSSTPFTITQNGQLCPQVGDYRTQGSDTWATPGIWQRYNYLSGTKTRAWQNAGSQPNDATVNVTVRAGHTVTLSDGPKSINNLIIESGGRLYRNSTASFTYLNLGGDILCNGNFGNGTTSDAINLNIQAGDHTISGSGSFNCWRIRLSNETNNGASTGSATLTIDMDVNLRWPSDGGKNAIYNGRNGTGTFDVIVNAGRTLSVTDATASIGMDGTNSAGGYVATERGGGYTVHGSIVCAGELMLGSNNGAAYRPYLRIMNGGVVETAYLNHGDNNVASGGELTIQNGGTLRITGVGSGQDAWLNTGVGSMVYSIASGSTVEYSRSGNQNVPALFSHHHLIFSGSGTKSFTGTSNTVNGNFTLNGTAACGASTASSTLSLAGNISMNGTSTFANTAFDNLTIATIGNGAQTFTGNGNLIRCQNFTSAKTSGSVSLSASTPFSTKSALTLTYSGTAAFNAGANTITVGGTWTNTNESFFNEGTSTVIFNGTGNVSVTGGGGEVFHDVTVNGGTRTLTTAITASRDLSIQSGTLDVNTQNHGVTVGRNWTNTATFTPRNGTVTFNGSGAQTIATGGTGAGKTFWSVTKSGAGTATLTAAMQGAGNLTLSGGTFSTGAGAGNAVTFSGTLDVSAPVTLNLGTGAHSVTVANSSGLSPWGGSATLTVTSWTGTAGNPGTARKLMVGTANTGLTCTQLDKISFTGYASGALIRADGEVVPRVTALVLTGSTICASPGNDGTITSSTSTTGVSYQLFNSSNSPVGAPVAGTGSGLNWSGLSVGNGYYARPVGGCNSSNTVNVSFNPNPTISGTGTVAAVCPSSVSQTTTLAYSATTNSPTSYSIDWSAAANTAGLSDQGSTVFAFAAGGGSLSNISIPANVSPGTYSGTMTVVNANGCEGTLAVSITINAPLSISGISGNISLCANATQTLTATGVSGTGATVTWWTGAGGTGTNLGTGTDLNGAAPGTYFARVTGACAAVEESITVNSLEIPAITSVTAPAMSLCANATQTLTANGVGGASAVVTWWTGAGGTGTNLGTGMTLANRGPGTYHARVTGTCSPAVEASITIIPIAIPAITSVTAPDASLCANATQTLTANGVAGDAATVTWWTGAGGTGTNLGTGNTLTAGPGTFFAQVTGTCTPAAEQSITVGSIAIPAIASISAPSASLCPGATQNLTATGVAGAGATVNWWDGPNATGTSLGSGVTLSGVGTGTFYARVTGTCATPMEESVTIGALVAPAITSVTASDASICASATQTLTANGVAGDAVTVTWWTGTGGSGTNLGTGNTLTAGPGTFFARVTGTCTPAAEQSITVGSIASPTITSVTAPATSICPDATQTLTANGVTGNAATVTWWTGAGGTGTNLGTGTTLANAGPGTYYARVTGTCAPAAEQSLTVSAFAVPAITSVTAPDLSICANATQVLTANGVAGQGATVTWWTGTGGTGTSLGTGTTLPNRGPGTYYARVTGTCTPAAEASITVNSLALPAIISVTAPDPSVCVNETQLLTTNGVAGEAATVTWWTGVGGTGTNLGSGSTLTAGPGTYYARVTGTCSPAAEQSITVGSIALPAIASIAAAEASICANATQTLSTVGVAGGAASVTWWTGPNGTGTNLGTGVSLPNAGPGTYYARVTGSCSPAAEVSTTIGTIAIPAITSVTAPSPTICYNAIQTLTANGVAGDAALVTWWTEAGGNGTNLGTGVNLSAGPGTYFARVTGTCAPAVEQGITVGSLAAPSITTQPQTPADICPGYGMANISVAATGAGLSYSWRHNGTPVTNGGVYSGQGTSTLTVTAPSLANGGSYDVVITGTCTPPVTSSAVTLTVLSLSVKQWEGDESNNWHDPLNWGPCPGVPVQTDAVTIPSVPTLPVISAAAQSGSLTVNSGAGLTIGAGHSLVVHGNLANSGTAQMGSGTLEFRGATAATVSGQTEVGRVYTDKQVTITGQLRITDQARSETGGNIISNGNFVLMSGGQLLHGTATPNGGGTVTGNITVQRQGSPIFYNYNYWSTPVVGGNMPGIGYWYDSSQGTNGHADDNNPADPGWQSHSGAMATGRGYASIGGGLASFTGIANNGNIGYTVISSPEALESITAPTRFNLVGNPYPSALNANSLIAANTGTMAGVIYLWSEDDQNSFGSQGSDYAVYSTIGSVSTAPGWAGGMTPNGSIATTQGFMIDCETGGTLNFTNAMRGGDNSQFFRMAEDDGMDRIWLNMYSSTRFNQVLVAFRDDATDGRDLMYDAYKVQGNGSIALAAHQQGDWYAIATFPTVTTDRIVPLRTYVSQAGNYTFEVDSLDGFTEVTVYLEDLQTGQMHVLTPGTTVGVQMGPNDEYGRFQLRFMPELVTGLREADDVTGRVFVGDRDLRVMFSGGLSTDGTLRVLDLTGKVVYQQRVDLQNGMSRPIDASSIATGIYVAEFIGREGHMAKGKVMLR
jgi:uncharacterized repeat protein (TIGR02543 family)